MVDEEGWDGVVVVAMVEGGRGTGVVLTAGLLTEDTVDPARGGVVVVVAELVVRPSVPVGGGTAMPTVVPAGTIFFFFLITFFTILRVSSPLPVALLVEGEADPIPVVVVVVAGVPTGA